MRWRALIGVGVVAVVAVAVVALRPSDGDGRAVFIQGQTVISKALPDGAATNHGDVPRGARGLSFSPEGDRLAYELAGTAYVLELNSGDAREVTEGQVAGWTGDGQLLVFVSADDGQRLMAVGDGDEQVLLGPGPWRLEGDVAWLEREHYAVRLVDTDTNRAGMVIVDQSAGVVHTIPDAHPLTPAAEGSELLYAVGAPPDQNLAVISVRTLESRTFRLAGTFNDAAVNAGGLPAVAAVDPTGEAGVWILDRQAREFELVIGEGDRVEWSPDGSTLIYSRDGELWARRLDRNRPDRIEDVTTRFFRVVA